MQLPVLAGILWWRWDLPLAAAPQTATLLIAGMWGMGLAIGLLHNVLARTVGVEPTKSPVFAVARFLRSAINLAIMLLVALVILWVWTR